MKTRITKIILAGVLALAAVPAEAKSETRASFNAANCLLPSSQYTPEKPYSALVWVFNEGKRYADSDYNHIWATPSADKAGREWYQPDYEPAESNTAASWSMQTAPFSSDEYYKDQKSYRWITSDITGEIYMRRTFTLNEIPAGAIYLACGHDDAPAEWYINGELVHTVSDGWNNDEYVLLSDSQKALLKAGENLLAVHVHQNWGGAFADCGLYEADMSLAETYLGTVADGPWNCAYYILNYNNDIELAEKAEWYAADEDEADWISGVGPFSNDNNMFYITEWPSQVRPILVRRHFTLETADFGADSHVFFTCSYDENPVVYLNGTRLWSASGWNDNNYATIELTAEQKKLLRDGDNVLAVSLMQGAGGGHIDYGLYAELPYDPSGAVDAVEVEPINNDNRIYDLFGRYVGTSADKLSRGIYIRGGKKVILGI